MKRVFTIFLAVLMLAVLTTAMASATDVPQVFTGTVSTFGEVVDVQDTSIDALDADGLAELKSGNHEKWIDRLDLTDAPYALELYEWLEDNSGLNCSGALAVPEYEGHQSSGDVVCLNNSYYVHSITEFSGSCTASYEVVDGDEALTTANATAAAEAAVGKAIEGQLDTVSAYAAAVFYAFDRDNMWNFWLSGQMACMELTSFNFRYADGVVSINYTNTICFCLKTPVFDIRDAKYICDSDDSHNDFCADSTAIEVTIEDKVCADLASDATTYDKVKHFHDWLTQNHHYDLEGGSDALYGLWSGKGIVCEGYARAFKLLCDEADIPCVLVDGIANGEAHMWNYVQMEDGKWYAVDVTWDDPVVTGVSSDVSGYERYDYFLVGTDTLIDGESFISSHPVSNKPSDAAPAYTNGPVLNAIAYGSIGGQCGDDVYWSFDEETGTLTIFGEGDMWGFPVGAPWGDLLDSINNIIIEDGVTSIGYCAFSSCSNMTNIIVPESVSYIGSSAFAYCSSLEYIAIPDGAILECSIFWGCTSLVSVELPDNVKYIPQQTFQDCSSLKTIIIPDGVIDIEIQAFYGCSSLENLIIPNNVSLISYGAFWRCGALTEVVFPSSVTKIKDRAFDECEKLKTIYFEGNAPEVTEAGIVQRSFPSNAILYYIPGTTGWTDSEYYDAEAGTWNGYKLEKWFENYSAADCTVSDSGKTLNLRHDQACVVLIAHADGTYTRLTPAANPEGGYDFDISGMAAGGKILIAVKGDVTMNGVIEGADAIQIKAAQLGKLTTFTELQTMIADLDGDGVIEGAEAIQAKAAQLGKLNLSW